MEDNVLHFCLRAIINASGKFDITASKEAAMHRLERCTLMRLLILTMKFLVECHVTFGINLSCVNGDKNAYKKAHPSQYPYHYEVKQHGFEQTMMEMQPTVFKLFTSQRNLQMRDGNMLTMSELTVIRLYTNESFNQMLNKYYFQGNSCQFRDTSVELLRAARKLMKNDTIFDILKYRQYCQLMNQPCALFHGLRDIYFDPNQYKSKLNMIKLQNVIKKELNLHDDHEDCCCLMFNKFTWINISN